MDKELEELLQRAMEELCYWYNHDDVVGMGIDTTDTEAIHDEIEQALYKHDCSKVELIDGRPKPVVLRGYI